MDLHKLRHNHLRPLAAIIHGGNLIHYLYMAVDVERISHNLIAHNV